MENFTKEKREKLLRLALVIVAVFFVNSLNFDGRVPYYRTEFNTDTIYARIQEPKHQPEIDTMPAVDTTAVVVERRDVPLDIARLIGKDLIVSTEGLPLDEALIWRKIEEEQARRADTSMRFQQNYCKESMVYFNIADDWAQIITFRRKDDTFLVFLIQYYDWDEGYGVISNRYYIYDGEALRPTTNPLKRFGYLANNKDTVGVRYDFRMVSSKYDPTRLKLNTVMKDVELGKVEDVIHAEFLWTGRDFVELASDHTMPKRNDIVKAWQNAMPQDAELPNQYARTDIDSDGNDEYIFSVNDGSNNKFAIFTYINDKLNIIVGNYGSNKDISMLQGGYVVMSDSVQSRHFHLVGSEINGIYHKKGDAYTYKADKSAPVENITADDYQKAIRRARRKIEYKQLDWRFWSVETAR